jgi:hypothetical protein
MHVELSVDAAFAAPPAVKGLHKEVKVVKAWLEGLELFGDPDILNEEVPLADAPPDLIPLVEKVAEVLGVIGEGVEVEHPVLPSTFV